MTKTTSKKTMQDQPSPAPFGLQLLFSALKEKDLNIFGVKKHAEVTLPLATAIVYGLHNVPDFQIGRVLETATGKLFAGAEELNEPSTVADAAFHVGVATAWLMMQELRGQGEMAGIRRDFQDMPRRLAHAALTARQVVTR